MKKPILLAIIASALFASCQKNEAPSPTGSKNVPGGIKSKNLATIAADVYVAGDYQLQPVAGVPQFAVAYWKNGTAVTLPSTVGNGTSHAQAISVSGTDVYVVGYDQGTNISATVPTTSGLPCIWKNGVEQQLPIPVGGFTGEATAIAISGTDVYVAGFFVTNDATQSRRAVMWKNGVATMIAFNKFDSIATGIALDGTDVYISGNAVFSNITCAVYWKNNAWHPFAGTTAISRASAIVVDALHNYYISGASNGEACYWKDGNIKLLTTNDYAAPITAQNELWYPNSIAVSNNNVYVSGVNIPTGPVNPPDPDDPNPGLQVQAVYWKNGQEVSVSGQSEHGGPSSIAVIADQAYTAGTFNSGTSPFYTINQNVTSINNPGIPFGVFTIRGIAVVQH